MTYSQQHDDSMSYGLLFIGIASLVLGLLLFTQTQATLTVLMLLIGILWFVQGIAALLDIFINKSEWGWKLFFGVIGIAAGWLVFKMPVESATVVPAIFAWLLGLFGIIMGIGALIGAFKGGGWGVGILGVIVILIGLLFMFNSVVSGQFLVWLLALLLLIEGVVSIYYAFKYK